MVNFDPRDLKKVFCALKSVQKMYQKGSQKFCQIYIFSCRHGNIYILIFGDPGDPYNIHIFGTGSTRQIEVRKGVLRGVGGKIGFLAKTCFFLGFLTRFARPLATDATGGSGGSILFLHIRNRLDETN